MTPTKDEEDRRYGAERRTDIRSRLEDVEAGQVRMQRAVQKHYEAVHTELLSVRQLLGDNMLLAEKLKGMFVPLTDEAYHDHDAALMVDDTERGLLRALLAFIRRHDVEEQLRVEGDKKGSIFRDNVALWFTGAGLLLNVAFSVWSKVHGS